MAEATLNRKPEIRDERFEDSFTLATEVVDLPSDFREPIAMMFDDDVRFGPIEFVPSDMLPGKKALLGLTGFPRFASIIADATQVRLAPAPDTAYTVSLNYITKLVSLSDTKVFNWLITDHPDIYLYATLIESAPYLKDDDRLPMWKSELRERLEELRLLKERQRIGAGAPRIRPRRAIG